ncbi:MAG: hypothetical protein ACR2K6_11850 [Solirubrobacterales bacterium]
MARAVTTRRRGEGTGRIRSRRERGNALRTRGLFTSKPALSEIEGSELGGRDELADGGSRFDPGEDRPERIEEVLSVAWAALTAGHPIECPVCTGTMTAEDGCTDCGSKLS